MGWETSLVDELWMTQFLPQQRDREVLVTVPTGYSALGEAGACEMVNNLREQPTDIKDHHLSQFKRR